MKLYTKSGDDGSTGLFGGRRVSKDSLRIEACGTVDELNGAVGLAQSICRHPELKHILCQLQQRLFEIGADLATPEQNANPSTPRIGAEQIQAIEHQIDQVDRPLPQLKHFVLPGGSEAAARLHLARAMGRRAERVCVALSKQEPVNPDLLIYLNRLSDLLFAMARRANQLDDVEEIKWMGGASDQ